MLVKNGNILVVDDLEFKFKKRDIRLSGDSIAEIGLDIKSEGEEEVLDVKGDFIIPGMVNSHYHSYTNILRGSSYGEPLEIWSLDTISLGKLIEEQDARMSAQLGICEMLRSGVTSCIDHLPHLSTANTIAKVYQESGFKVALAPMLHNLRDSDVLYGMMRGDKSSFGLFPSNYEFEDFYHKFIKDFHNLDLNTQVMIGINSPQRIDGELLEIAADIQYRYKLKIHSHLLETKWQRVTADNDISPVLKLDAAGLLGDNTSLAHGIWVNEEELDLIAKRKATIVSNPTSNAFLGSGIFPLKKYLERKIPIVLGSDGSNCGTSHNMLEILRFFLLMQRVNNSNYTDWISIEEGFNMITKNSNQILNFKNSLGEIKIGSSADLAIIDKTDFIDILDSSLLIQLIFNMSNMHVKHVIINGEFAMKDSKILFVDEDSLRQKIRERKRKLKPVMEIELQQALGNKEIVKKALKQIDE
ncbi:MAG: amidohydrolase family protein [Gudongella sp.]|nr:amidohydrolase family protein [Gudongella sp.]